ncbi:MAG: putative peptidoglycan binding domain-containing protein [Candidatus Thorarchaeota archaeon]
MSKFSATVVNPSHLLPIQGEISLKIQQVLAALDFLSGVEQDVFPEAVKDALQRYISINNFENKMREDGKIWKSVYEWLFSDAGLES